MSKWQRVILTVLLAAEVVVTLLPMVRELFDAPAPDIPGDRTRPTLREPDVAVDQPRGVRLGVLLGTTMLLLFTAASALVPVWLRPRSRTWVATFTGTHLAAAGLGWAHGLTALAVLAAVSAVGVPLLVFAPPNREE